MGDTIVLAVLAFIFLAILFFVRWLDARKKRYELHSVFVRAVICAFMPKGDVGSEINQHVIGDKSTFVAKSKYEYMGYTYILHAKAIVDKGRKIHWSLDLTGDPSLCSKSFAQSAYKFETDFRHWINDFKHRGEKEIEKMVKKDKKKQKGKKDEESPSGI